MSSPSQKTVNSKDQGGLRVTHPFCAIFLKDKTMTFQQTLDLAEIEADRAFERYYEVLSDDEHPAYLDSLKTAAQLAQQR